MRIQVDNLYLKSFRNKLYSFEKAKLFCLIAIVLTLPFSLRINSICIILLGLAWILGNRFKEKIARIQQNKIALFFMGLYVLNIFGMFYTTDVKAGVSDLETKLSILVFPLILGSTAPLSKRHFQLLLMLFVSTCVLAALYCLIRALYYYFNLHTSQFFFYHKLSGGIGMHAVYLALFLSFSLFILTDYLIRYWTRIEWPRKMLSLLGMGLLLLTILLLASKTVILSLICFADVFSVLLFVSNKKKIGIFIVFILNIIALTSVIYVPFIHDRFMDSMQTDFSSIKEKDYNMVLTGISMRTGIWTYSLEILNETKSWWYGIGTGDSQMLLDEMYRRENWYLGVPGTNDRGYLGYNAHNQFIQFLLCLGLIGLIYFLIYQALPVIIAFQNKDYLLLALVLFFSVCCLTESMLCTQKGVVFYSLFLNLLLFQQPLVKSKTVVQ